MQTSLFKPSRWMAWRMPGPATTAPAVSVPRQLVYETLHGAQAIAEVQHFRARVFGSAYQIHFESGIDRDLFDAYSLHCVVRDQATGQIVACTRIITPEARLKIGYYACEKEFDLSEYLQGKQRVFELGRTCVDEDYRGGNTLGVLWLGMAPVLLSLRAKHLIGAVSINLGLHPCKLHAAQVYLQRKARTQPWKSRKVFNFEKHFSLQSWLEDGGKYQKKQVPSLFKKYRRLGACFSSEAYHDELFNCVDYFVAVKVNQRLLLKLQALCGILQLAQLKG